jgi:hypothetical protein
VSERYDLCQELQAGVTQELAEAESALREVTALRTAFEQKKKEEERKAAERKREEEHKAKIAAELNQAKEAEEAMKPFFARFGYAEAVQDLAARRAAMETDEGQAAMQVLLDRYTYLKALKAFLIEQINAKPFTWGWGSGPSARDVIGADETTIKLRGSQATWPDVTPVQMQKFITRYVMQAQGGRTTLAKHKLAAALMFRELGLADESAQFAEKASGEVADLKAEADRLLKPAQ